MDHNSLIALILVRSPWKVVSTAPLHSNGCSSIRLTGLNEWRIAKLSKHGRRTLLNGPGRRESDAQHVQLDGINQDSDRPYARGFPGSNSGLCVSTVRGCGGYSVPGGSSCTKSRSRKDVSNARAMRIVSQVPVLLVVADSPVRQRTYLVVSVSDREKCKEEHVEEQGQDTVEAQQGNTRRDCVVNG